MAKKLLLSLCSFCMFSMYSQTFEWVATHPINFSMNSEMIGYNTTTDPFGNFYMTGFKDNAFIYENIMGTQYYNKYDADGNLLFSKEITGNVNVYNLTTDSEGNIVLMLGYIGSINFETLGLISINEGINHLMLKLNNEGNVLWYREFSIEDSFVSGARAVTTDASDNIYISYDDYMHSYIEKINPEGTTLLTITQQHVRTVTSISVDNVGNIYAAGSCADQGATFENVAVPLPDELAYNVYLAKYSPSAVFQWVKYLDNITCPMPQVKAKTPDEIYLTSELFEDYSFDNITTEGPVAGFSDVYLAKLNAEGNFQWVREVPGNGSLSNGQGNVLALDDEGNIYFGGLTSGTVNWNDTLSTTTEGFGNRDAIVLKYNSAGEILMAKTAGGANQDRIDGISIGADGSIFVVGLASGNASFDEILIEADETQNYPFVAKITNESLKNHTTEAVSIVLYPNPSSDYVWFSNAPENLDGSIYNIVGQKIKDFSINKNQPISVKELANGTYFIKSEGLKALKLIKS